MSGASGSELAPLRIALTFDTDADFFDQSLVAGSTLPAPAWRGVAEGIPLILEHLRGIRDSGGNAARATWFVRSDNQLHELYGSHTFLLEQFASLWSGCSDAGDEIAWHPHLYRLKADAWVQETDAAELRRKLIESHAAVCKAGRRPFASRIGEAYCSNEIMATLDSLGIGADSTGMPGRRRVDGQRSIDWTGTPRSPYHPSHADYRVPGAPHRNLVEIPMSIVPVRADYDADPFPRYVDLSFHPRALADGIGEYVRTAELLVTMTHPSGVLSDLSDRAHGLISFSVDAFKENLDSILRAAARHGRVTEFVTIAQCAAEEVVS